MNSIDSTINFSIPVNYMVTPDRGFQLIEQFHFQIPRQVMERIAGVLPDGIVKNEEGAGPGGWYIDVNGEPVRIEIFDDQNVVVFGTSDACASMAFYQVVYSSFGNVTRGEWRGPALAIRSRTGQHHHG